MSKNQKVLVTLENLLAQQGLTLSALYQTNWIDTLGTQPNTMQAVNDGGLEKAIKAAEKFARMGRKMRKQMAAARLARVTELTSLIEDGLSMGTVSTAIGDWLTELTALAPDNTNIPSFTEKLGQVVEAEAVTNVEANLSASRWPEAAHSMGVLRTLNPAHDKLEGFASRLRVGIENALRSLIVVTLSENVLRFGDSPFRIEGYSLGAVARLTDTTNSNVVGGLPEGFTVSRDLAPYTLELALAEEGEMPAVVVTYVVGTNRFPEPVAETPVEPTEAASDLPMVAPLLNQIGSLLDVGDWMQAASLIAVLRGVDANNVVLPRLTERVQQGLENDLRANVQPTVEGDHIVVTGDYRVPGYAATAELSLTDATSQVVEGTIDVLSTSYPATAADAPYVLSATLEAEGDLPRLFVTFSITADQFPTPVLVEVAPDEGTSVVVVDAQPDTTVTKEGLSSDVIAAAE